MSDEEKSEIDKKAVAVGVSVADWIRQSLCRVRTWTAKDKETERERIREIRRIGQNLNQIARWCNQYKSDADAVSVIAHLVAIEEKIDSLSLPPQSRYSVNNGDKDAH